MGLVHKLLRLDAIHPSCSQHMAEQVLQEPAVARSFFCTVLRRKGGSILSFRCAVQQLTVVYFAPAAFKETFINQQLPHHPREARRR